MPCPAESHCTSAPNYFARLNNSAFLLICVRRVEQPPALVAGELVFIAWLAVSVRSLSEQRREFLRLDGGDIFVRPILSLVASTNTVRLKSEYCHARVRASSRGWRPSDSTLLSDALGRKLA